MKPLRIALTKGRLERDTVAMFERIGFDCTAVHEKGRKLILPIGDNQFEVVLAKAADVITYVEHGVCDLGVVGKDTIIENGSSFYEVLDLGFGKCKFALAAPKGTDFYSGYASKTIATKYPNVARSFFEGKGMDVKIIKIEGSVELAPLLGLSDAIIDIVETGSTLKENGLEVIEKVCDISARLIVNTASMKLRKQEIDTLINQMEQAKEAKIMIQLVEKDENTTRTYVQQLKQRCDEKDRKVDAIVADILENVRNNGDKAVAEYTLKFDGSIPEQVEITKEQMKELTKQCRCLFFGSVGACGQKYS